MRMRRFLWLLVSLLLITSVAASADGNLVFNGDFALSQNGVVPDGWYKDMWLTGSEISKLEVVNEGPGGQPCIVISNVQSNDARFLQTIDVEPNTYYRITGSIRAQGIDEYGSGANLSIMDTFVGTDYIYDTEGGWRDVELYGYTGPDQTELTLMCRVGDYGALTTGTAWFSNIRMVMVDEGAGREGGYSFQTFAPGEGDVESGPGFMERVSSFFSEGAQVVLLLLLGLSFAAIGAMLLWLVERGRFALPGGGNDAWRPLVWVLIAAAALRLVLAVTVRGYDTDITCFEAWSARLAQTGPVGFYAADYFCDYPPGYMYVLWIIGILRGVLGIAHDSNIDWLLIKLVPIALDIAMAMLLYRAIKGRVGATVALLIASLLALNPAQITNSAVWGQVDVALGVMLLCSILWAMDDKWHLSLPMFVLSILVKPQALMFAPLGLVVVVVRICRDKEPIRQLGRMALIIAASLIGALIVCLPFIWSLDPQLFVKAELTHLPALIRPVAWVVSLYGKTLSSYANLTLNACNLYVMLDKNWADIAANQALANFGYIMMALGYVYAAVLYIRAKDVNKLPVLAAFVLMWAFCFGPMMHERYLFPALALLLLGYAVDRDVRLMAAFLAVSFAQFMNAALVLRSEHLQAAEQIVNAGVSLVNLLSACLMAWTAWDLCYGERCIAITRVYYQADAQAQAVRESRLEQFGDRIFKVRDHKLNLRLRDWALMLLVTAVYAVIAFANLGDAKAPQSPWTSSAAGEHITIDLGQVQQFHLAFYGSSTNNVTFQVEMSDDGQTWTKPYYAEFREGLVFRWIWYEPMLLDPDARDGYSALSKSSAQHPLQEARYVRLIMEGPGLILDEIAFVDGEGGVLPIQAIQLSGGKQGYMNDTVTLFDEQDTVPAYPSYLNGTYFDEIYHARTAYENIHGLHTYEYTHPPLGKLLIALGIRMFGMTPFGWRFMGTLFGVLMVPLMFLLAKQLARRTSYAFIAALLMAFDLMHFTQTRIATIDSYAVFFIMLMYLLMFRYCQMSFYHVKLWRTLVPLGLCGITMGLAIASKWIGAYAAVGLAVLFFGCGFAARLREYRYVKKHISQIDTGRRPKAQRILKTHWRSQLITLSWCLVFFVAVPLLIYYFSYYWQLIPDNNFSPRGVWNTQLSMFRYHAGLTDVHDFSSPWYQWPVIAWPMWFYSGNEFMPGGWVSSISCMGNPAVFWTGLVAMLFVLGRLIWMGCNALASSAGKIGTSTLFERRYLLLGVGFLSQYLPWVLVPRSTYIYHYFASVPFIILATVFMLDYIRRRSQFAYKVTAIVLCVAAVLLFAFFYPVASGTPMPIWYARLLRWFSWVNY